MNRERDVAVSKMETGKTSLCFGKTRNKQCVSYRPGTHCATSQWRYPSHIPLWDYFHNVKAEKVLSRGTWNLKWIKAC